jgi:hypothetical protein
MGGLHDIDVEIAVEKHGAAHGGDTDGASLDIEMIHGIGHQPMDGPVVTAGAEMGLDVLETDGS